MAETDETAKFFKTTREPESNAGFVKNQREQCEANKGLSQLGKSKSADYLAKKLLDACNRLEVAEEKIEQQQKDVGEILKLCEKVQDWLNTSSLQEVLVHNCNDPRKDALIMGIANSLIRIEDAIAKAEEMLKGE